jgi:hypothetical protein
VKKTEMKRDKWSEREIERIKSEEKRKGQNGRKLARKEEKEERQREKDISNSKPCAVTK